MPRGWGSVEQAEQERKLRQEQWENSRFERVVVNDGETADVRFLEMGDDVFIYYSHRLNPIGGEKYGRLVVCINQDDDDTECPACNADIKRGVRAALNVIQRQRPILRRGGDGKAVKDSKGNWVIDSYADAIAVFECPQVTAEKLRKKDAKIKGGLMSRDFTISKTGNSFDPWEIELADADAGAVPLTADDEKLIKDKYDIAKLYEPESFVDLARKVSGTGAASSGGGSSSSGGSSDADGDGDGDGSTPPNAFLKNRQDS